MQKSEQLVINGNEVFDFIEYALRYENICDLEFRNCAFLVEDLEKLNNSKIYDRIAFINCTFEKADLIKKIKTTSLSLISNKISNYDFVYEMFF